MIVAAAISVVISADVAAAELAAVVTVTAVTTVAVVAAELIAIVEAYSIIACGCPSYVKISTSLDSSKRR